MPSGTRRCHSQRLPVIPRSAFCEKRLALCGTPILVCLHEHAEIHRTQVRIPGQWSCLDRASDAVEIKGDRFSGRALKRAKGSAALPRATNGDRGRCSKRALHRPAGGVRLAGCDKATQDASVRPSARGPTGDYKLVRVALRDGFRRARGGAYEAELRRKSRRTSGHGVIDDHAVRDGQ